MLQAIKEFVARLRYEYAEFFFIGFAFSAGVGAAIVLICILNSL
jgi:hypothetical protein